MHLILMGPQGSGKGTQAAALAPLLTLHHLSTGDMFRSAIASGSDLGKQLQGILERGDLVTDELTIRLVQERLDAISLGLVRSGSGDQPAEAPVAHGALFDGFPRTRPQADALDELLGLRSEWIDSVIEIAAPEDALVRRLVARGRDDDQPDAIRRRLTAYHDQTAPLLALYRSRDILLTVNGHQSMEAVTAEILEKLSERLGPQKFAGIAGVSE